MEEGPRGDPPVVPDLEAGRTGVDLREAVVEAHGEVPEGPARGPDGPGLGFIAPQKLGASVSKVPETQGFTSRYNPLANL